MTSNQLLFFFAMTVSYVNTTELFLTKNYPTTTIVYRFQTPAKISHTQSHTN